MTNEEIIDLMYGNNPLVSKELLEALKMKAREQDLNKELERVCQQEFVKQNVNQN